jgi:hypothetical protein
MTLPPGIAQCPDPMNVEISRSCECAGYGDQNLCIPPTLENWTVASRRSDLENWHSEKIHQLESKQPSAPVAPTAKPAAPPRIPPLLQPKLRFHKEPK